MSPFPRAALLGLLVLLPACGGGASTPAAAPSASTAAADAYPVTVQGADGELVVPERPERIVSLSPTATETLFALGADEQVVAVDDQSDFPAEAPRTDLSGFTPNVEAIAGYEPDLVVVSDDLGGVVEGLRTLDVPVLVQPAAADLEEAYAQMEALGAATGLAEEADALVEDLQERVDAAAASLPDAVEGLRLYHEVDDTLFSATSGTFAGSVEERFGLVNVADEAASEGNAYPQLSAEYLVTSAPQVVVLADTTCCGVTAESFAARPGFAELPAVTEGRVIEVEDALASRWGPRLADFAEALAAALKDRA